MSYPGRYKFRAFRKDANHATVKTALTLAQIDFIDAAAYGFPCDFIIPLRGRIFMLEVKDGDKPPSQQSLTDEEEILANMLTRNGCKLHVVKSPEEALDILQPEEREVPERLRAWK